MIATKFQRRRLKCEKLTDDGRQVMAKAHIAFGKVSKKGFHVLTYKYHKNITITKHNRYQMFVTFLWKLQPTAIKHQMFVTFLEKFQPYSNQIANVSNIPVKNYNLQQSNTKCL